MNQDFNKTEIEKTLQNIYNHKLFANSPTYKRLLEYLVEKSLAEEDLKEYSIGTDLYGIDYAEDKNNSTVRSYMYKLRKKLADYYEETCYSDSVIFIIEKGQYNLDFANPKKSKSQNKQKKLISIPIKYPITAFAIVLVALATIWALKNFSSPNSYIWKPFFLNNTNNLVVVADHFVVNEIDSLGMPHATVESGINSHHDLDVFLKKHPQRKLEATDYTLLSKMAPYGIKTLSEWFMKNNSPFELELESKLSYNDVKHNNIVFIGQYKSMNISRSLFLKDSKVFSTFGDGFKYTNDEKEKIFNTRHSALGKVEYAMVSYTSISEGKKAIYFVSNNDIGVMATLNKFTNKEWLKSFSSELPDNDSHFNALFKVSGLQRTDVSCELAELEILE